MKFRPASATGIGGTFGDYSGNLARQRGIDKADEQSQEVPCIAGQLAGAVALPAKAAAQEAAARIEGALQRDALTGSERLTLAEFAAAREAAEPVVVADMGGETTRALARSAENTSPEARESKSGGGSEADDHGVTTPQLSSHAFSELGNT